MMQRLFSRFSAGVLITASLVYAQSTASGQSGWRRVGDPAPAGQTTQPVDPNFSQAPPQYPGNGNQQPYPNQINPNGPAVNQQPATPPPPIPPTLQVPAGTSITVRTNSILSSDQNHPGDAFSVTLAQPVVVNGVVVAEPGQTITGQVEEAEKAGRVGGTARLRIQLTELTLVDGQQIPIQTELISRRAGSSVGRDAAAMAGTTGLGAAIGAAAGWGTGAAIGAGAGAAVGLMGVLLTRGHPSVIYPEETLTFRLEAPLTIDTQRSAQAFRYVQPNEYNQPLYSQPPPTPAITAAPVPVVAPPPYYYGYPSYYYGGYPYYGPSFSFFVGRGWYGPRWYGGPGWYGRGFGPRGWRR